MIERRLNKNHDIYISNGNLELINGVDQIVQNIDVRLRFFLQEYFLDQTIGVPWFQEILRRNINIDQIESRLKLEILNTDGVTGIETFSVDFERFTRSLIINFNAVTSLGLTGAQEVIING